jgi:hypothetical protein
VQPVHVADGIVPAHEPVQRRVHRLDLRRGKKTRFAG